MAPHERTESLAVSRAGGVNQFAIRSLGHRCARGSRENLVGMQPRSKIE
jgi:hypothetical protein